MNASNDWNELNGAETTGGRGEDVLIVRIRRALAIGLAMLASSALSAFMLYERFRKGFFTFPP